MKNITFKLIFLVLGLLLVGSVVLAGDSILNIHIKSNQEQKTANLYKFVELDMAKAETNDFGDILAKYKVLKDDFKTTYKSNRKLMSESSTVRQAFNHSKTMLETCMAYMKDYSDLKDHAILQLLVGEWKGKARINFTEKDKDYKVNITRKLEISFESNQAGQISKGIVSGLETYEKKKLQNDNASKSLEMISEPGVKKKIKEIKGAILGNIIPQADSTLIINIDKDSTNKEVPRKFDQLELQAKTIVEMDPIVERETLDEAYSLTVSHMKIYYNLLFKTRRPIEEVLKDKYNLFFIDILYLLKMISQGYISKEVYEPLDIYPKSDYVNKAFEDYVMTLGSYYSKILLKAPNKAAKIIAYKAYLAELIQASSICYTGIVHPSVKDHLDININKKDNLISKIFIRYYKLGKEYYSEEIDAAKGDKKTELKKEYKQFEKDVQDFVKTGIILDEILKELDIQLKTGKKPDAKPKAEDKKPDNQET